MGFEKRNNIIVIISVLLSVVAIIIGIIISLVKDPSQYELENNIPTKPPNSRTDKNTDNATSTDEQTSIPTQSKPDESSPQSSQSTEVTEDLPTELTKIEEKTLYSLGANFRDAPNLETSNILSYLDRDTKIIVNAVIGEWYFGTVNGVEGYVHMDVVSEQAPTTIQTPDATPTSSRKTTASQEHQSTNLNNFQQPNITNSRTATPITPPTQAVAVTIRTTKTTSSTPAIPSGESAEQTSVPQDIDFEG